MTRLSALFVVLLIPGLAHGQSAVPVVDACSASMAEAVDGPTETAARDVRAGSPSVAERFVGRFYASAMDTERIDALGIGVLQADLDRVELLQSSVEVAAFLGDLHAAGRFILFRPGVTRNFRDSGLDVFHVIPGGLSLPRESYYLRQDAVSVVVRDKYREHVSTLLSLANIFSNTGLDRSAPDPEAQTERIFEMETRLAAALIGPNDHRLVNDTGAAATTPSIDWPAYRSVLGAGGGDFLFPEGPFFAEVETMLRELTMEDWRAYLRWHLLRTAAPYLAAPFADEHARFYQTFLGGGIQQDELRWSYAQRMVRTLALPALNSSDDRWAPFYTASDDYFGNVLRARAFAAQQTFARLGSAGASAGTSACEVGD